MGKELDLGKYRSILWRLSLKLVLGGGLCYLLSNIVLNSSWSRQYLADKLSQRTGLDWQIDTANWTPNGKLHLIGVSAPLGDGSVVVGKVDVVPRWGELVNKRLNFKEVLLTDCKIELSLEWLREQMASQSSSALPLIPPDRSLPPAIAGGSSTKQRRKPPSNKPNTSKPKLNRQPVTQAPDHPSAIKQTELVSLERRVKIDNLKLTVSRAGKELLEIDGLSADIPFGGSKAEGGIRWEEVKLLDQQLSHQGEVPLQWKKELLQLPVTELSGLGIDSLADMQLKRSQGKWLFAAQWRVPRQKLEQLNQFGSFSLDLSAELLEGGGRMGGILTEPTRWRGGFAGRFSGLQLREGHRGGLVAFDRGFVRGELAGGRCIVPEFTMIGEDMALLGNGVMHTNTYGYAVLRLVCSPEKAEWMDTLQKGAYFFERKRHTIFRDLDSNDRQFIDVRFDGALAEPMMRLEEFGDWQPFYEALQRLCTFTREEREEDEVITKVLKGRLIPAEEE